MPGCSASVSTRRMISSTVSIATSGLSRLIYRSTDSRSWLAARVHFSLTLVHPSPHHCLVFNKLARLSFLESALDGADEPFFVIEIAFDRLVNHPCARAAYRAGVINEAIERYLDYEEWFVGAVKRGLKEAETGELVEHQAVVRRWVNKREAKVDPRR